MRVFVDKKVKAIIDSFYSASLELHIALDENVVILMKDILLS